MLMSTASISWACTMPDSSIDIKSSIKQFYLLPDSIGGFETIKFPRNASIEEDGYENVGNAEYRVASHEISVVVNSYYSIEKESDAGPSETQDIISKVIKRHKDAIVEIEGKKTFLIDGVAMNAVGKLFTWIDSDNTYVSFLFIIPHQRHILKISATYIRRDDESIDAMASTIASINSVISCIRIKNQIPKKFSRLH